MENPNTWSPVERVIAHAMDDFEEQQYHLVGLSLIRMIADALRNADLLKEDAFKA